LFGGSFFLFVFSCVEILKDLILLKFLLLNYIYSVVISIN